MDTGVPVQFGQYSFTCTVASNLSCAAVHLVTKIYISMEWDKCALALVVHSLHVQSILPSSFSGRDVDDLLQHVLPRHTDAVVCGDGIVASCCLVDDSSQYFTDLFQRKVEVSCADFPPLLLFCVCLIATYWLVGGWLGGWFGDGLVGWSAGWVVWWLVCRVVDWVVGWVVGRVFWWLVGMVVGRVGGLVVGWWSGWLGVWFGCPSTQSCWWYC